MIEDILESAVKYFHLQSYYKEVFWGDNVLKVAFSYQAYAAMLKDFCDTVLRKIVDEENVVKQQSTEESYLFACARKCFIIVSCPFFLIRQNRRIRC